MELSKSSQSRDYWEPGEPPAATVDIPAADAGPGTAPVATAIVIHERQGVGAVSVALNLTHLEILAAVGRADHKALRMMQMAGLQVAIEPTEQPRHPELRLMGAAWWVLAAWKATDDIPVGRLREGLGKDTLYHLERRMKAMAEALDGLRGDDIEIPAPPALGALATDAIFAWDEHQRERSAGTLETVSVAIEAMRAAFQDGRTPWTEAGAGRPPEAVVVDDGVHTPEADAASRCPVTIQSNCPNCGRFFDIEPGQGIPDHDCPHA